MQQQEFLERMHTAFSGELPGIKAHQLLTPGKRPLSRQEVENVDEYRDSAVAIVCFPINGVVHSLLIQRPDYNGTHGGQISFPGGKMETSDKNIEFTARRETQEEIGWKLDEIHCLGKLTELFIPVSKFSVQPFLYYTETIQKFILDEREVAEIIQFPVANLQENSIVKSTTIRLSTGINMKGVPYFDIENRIVWGATAIILSELREMIK